MRRVTIRRSDGFDWVVVARAEGETIVYVPHAVPWAAVHALLTSDERAALAEVA